MRSEYELWYTRHLRYWDCRFSSDLPSTGQPEAAQSVVHRRMIWKGVRRIGLGVGEDNGGGGGF